MLSRGPAKLLLHRDFAIFWAGQSLSAMGDAFAFVALPLLVLEATGSVKQMGLLTATFGVGHAVTGLFSGAVVDWADRRRLMIACDVARALLFASVPLTWITTGPCIPLLYVVTALGAVLGNLFSVGYVTATANLVEPSELTRANSRLQVSQGLAYVLGPTLAGIVAAKLGPSSAVGVDALSFVVSAASLLFIRLRRPTSKRPDEGMFEKLIGGVSFLFRQPVLRAVTIFLLLTSMLDAGLFDLFIYLVKRDFGRDDSVVGLVLGIGATGAILGAVVAPFARERFGFGVCFLGATALEAAGMLATTRARSLEVVALGAILFSAAVSIRGISSISLRQRITPDHLLGRVTSIFWTLGSAMMPVGAALSTSAAATYSTRPVIAVCGVLIGAVALRGLLTPMRQAHPEASGDKLLSDELHRANLK